jgi:glycosyltransferase involved in cell wall biosynthesis
VPNTAHRIYKRLRPILHDLGVLNLARSLFSSETRRTAAERIGLAGFNTAEATGARLPWWRDHPRHRGRSINFDGVNLIGDLQADTGMSEVTRQTLNALQTADVPVAYTELTYGPPSRTTPLPPGIRTGAPYSFDLVDVHFSQFYSRVMAAPPNTFEGKFIIAYWGWELPEFPEISRTHFSLIDEIWVYSEYVQESISRISPLPVIRMPPAVDVAPGPQALRSTYDLPEDRFIFFFSFSPASMLARKNPFGVIEAFRRAFGKADDAPLLLIKTHHLSAMRSPSSFVSQLKNRLESVGGRLLDRNLTRQQMTDLMAVCDCYVSLHRAEGFGLGMAEAMALGKPVIATYYSGNTDFMTPFNSYPVRYHLREITDEDHRYQPEFSSLFQIGQLWAEPDLDHAAEIMWSVGHEKKHEAAQIGRSAAKHVEQMLKPAVIGERMRNRLRIIAETHT